jgi:hypothetical protein
MLGLLLGLPNIDQNKEFAPNCSSSNLTWMALMLRGMNRVWESTLLKMQPLLCRMVPFAAIFCILAWCLVSLHSNFANDDADSEILNQAWRLTNGENIYRDVTTPPFAFAAYPPLYFSVVAALMKFTGLSFIPAKLFTFIAALSIGAAFIYLSRKWKKTGWNGLWAASFLFLIPAFLFNAIRSHVQIMAVALSIWSMVFFLQNRWKAATVLSPLLAVLAIYTKQTQIALPLAIVLFLAFRNRRWLIPYLAILTGAIVLPFLWLQAATGGNFFLNTVQQANLAYNVFQIPLILIHHSGPVFIIIGFALHICWKRYKAGEWQAMDYYLVCVLIITIVSLGRIGAHGQYVVELIVVSLLYLLYATDFPFIQKRKLLVSIQILILFIYTPLFIFVEEGLGNISSYRAAKKIYPLLQAGSGPILSQQGSFALFARGEIYVQLFHFTGLSRAGLWDQRHLTSRIEEKIISYAITEFPIETSDLSADDRERFTPEILQALRENYYLTKAIPPYYIYVPKQSFRELSKKNGD